MSLKLNHLRISPFFALIILFQVLVGCETNEDRAVAKAQECLNSSTGSAAQACLNYIQGFTSAKSYMIRCSVAFVIQGFDQPTKFSDAFKAMQESAGQNGSPTLALLGKLSFTGANAASDATQARQDCQKSESVGMITFSSLVSIATTFSVSISGFETMTESQRATAIANMGTSSDESLGASARAAEEVYCKEGGTQDNSEICNDLQSATASGASDAEIGASLRCVLRNLPPNC